MFGFAATHAQFNRKSGIFGLPIRSFQGRCFQTAGYEGDTWRLCDGAVTWGVSTDTFPFQAIMEGSWDCEALAFFILVGWSPSSITCYLQVIFGDFRMAL